MSCSISILSATPIDVFTSSTPQLMLLPLRRSAAEVELDILAVLGDLQPDLVFARDVDAVSVDAFLGLVADQTGGFAETC